MKRLMGVLAALGLCASLTYAQRFYDRDVVIRNGDFETRGNTTLGDDTGDSLTIKGGQTVEGQSIVKGSATIQGATAMEGKLTMRADTGLVRDGTAGLLQFGGGDPVGHGNGAFIEAYGNTASNTGQMRIFAGNVAGGDVLFYTDGTNERGGVYDGGAWVFKSSATVQGASTFEDNVGIGAPAGASRLELTRTSVDSNPGMTITNDAQSWKLHTVGARSDRFEVFNETAGGAAANAYLSIGTDQTIAMTGQTITKGSATVLGAASFGDLLTASTFTATYAGGSAHLCVTDAGLIFASEAACP